METRTGAGAAYVFPVGALDDQAELDNRHNVAGQVTDQVAATGLLTWTAVVPPQTDLGALLITP